MPRPPPVVRRNGFTFVELLLAMALGALAAAILAVLIHGLMTAGDIQSDRLHGPVAARSALRTLSREAACAFAPPVQNLTPMELTTSTEPGKPEVRLAFYAPAPDAVLPGGYDILRVAYEVHRSGDGRKELRRLDAPCSGPLTNAPSTNILLQGRFTLAIEALENETPHAEWPPPDQSPPALPPSLHLALTWNKEPPFETETLVQAATGIRSPLERETPAEPLPGEPAE